MLHVEDKIITLIIKQQVIIYLANIDCTINSADFYWIGTKVCSVFLA